MATSKHGVSGESCKCVIFQFSMFDYLLFPSILQSFGLWVSRLSRIARYGDQKHASFTMVCLLFRCCTVTTGGFLLSTHPTAQKRISNALVPRRGLVTVEVGLEVALWYHSMSIIDAQQGIVVVVVVVLWRNPTTGWKSAKAELRFNRVCNKHWAKYGSFHSRKIGRVQHTAGKTEPKGQVVLWERSGPRNN